MELSIIAGVIIPFVGTSLGAAFVFFMRKNLSCSRNRLLDKRHEICYHMIQNNGII